MDMYAAQRKWREKNKEQKKEYDKQYRIKNKERLRQINKEYIQAGYGKEWYQKSKDKMQQKRRRARQKDAIKYTLYHVKSRCKKKNIPFDITSADIDKPQNCPVLGITLLYAHETGKKRPDNLATLDRIVPSKGYVKGNVIVVSFRVNRIKYNASINELKQIAEFYTQYQ